MSLEKAILVNTITQEKIPVMFNPEEYTTNRENNFAQTAIPGLSAPILQFVSGNLQTLEMELFLDTYESHDAGGQILNRAGEDVRRLTGKITDLMNIDPSTHAPPVLLFVWSSLSFTCVLARANQRFILFLPDGTPVRARLQITFNEFRSAEQEAREVKRETSDYSRLHIVSQGENLSTIAWRAYGNPALWRPIALRNQIDNPRELPTGLELILPMLPYRDPDTGEVFPQP
jgi:nucleoid-associated protein YgaU